MSGTVVARAGLLAMLVWAAPARAEGVAVRVGDHPGFGRIVFDLPARAQHETVREGDRLLLVFRDAGPVAAAARPPRNVLSIEGGSESATIVLAAGARVRTSRLERRLVIDVLDQVAPRPSPERQRTSAPEEQKPPKPGVPAEPAAAIVLIAGPAGPAAAAPAVARTVVPAVAPTAGTGAMAKTTAASPAVPAPPAPASAPAPGGAAQTKPPSVPFSAAHPASRDAPAPTPVAPGASRQGDAAPAPSSSPAQQAPSTNAAALPASAAASRPGPDTAADPATAPAAGPRQPGSAPTVPRSTTAAQSPVAALIPASLEPPEAAVRAGLALPAAAVQAEAPAAPPRIPAAPGAAGPMASPAASSPSSAQPGPARPAPLPRTTQTKGTSAPAPAMSPVAAPVLATTVPAPTTPATEPASQPGAAPTIPVQAEALAAPGAAPATPPPAAPPTLLPADAATGAAAFRRGPFGIVVLDRRPPGTAAAPAMFQLPLSDNQSLRLARVAEGWSVATVTDAKPGSMQPTSVQSGLLFPLARPGRVMTVLDPVSGGTLLVGTSLDADDASAQPDARRTPAYALLPSWAGIVVEAASDATDLRAVKSGFLLEGGTLQPIVTAGALTRRFDLPDGDMPALMNRLRAQLMGAATSPPRARARERLAAAGTMIALGLGAEAQALAQLAAADDPQSAADAATQALAAVAAILAGRPAEADALDDPRLDGTDEVQLWRGLRERRMGKLGKAAQDLASKAPLALVYPAPLARLILPEVAEAAVEAGASFPEDRLTPFARALLLERRGKQEEALGALDKLVLGPDRLDRMRAAARAAEIRLAAGQITPADAAAVMERQSFAWRGDDREAGLWIRAAELRGRAGEWRGALQALREVETAFPEQKPVVRARMADVLQAMLAAEGGTLSPLDVVLLAMEHAEGALGGEAGPALSRLLAAKLSALDLPARAIPVLQGLMQGAPAGEGRAALGARLAQMLLDGDETAAAQAALEGSAADDLPAPLRDARMLLRARAMAASGDTAGAVVALAALGTPAAYDLRASLLAKSGDWSAAAAALSELVASSVPPAGPLDDAAQDLMVRLATAAAQAGDPGLLRQIATSAQRLTPPRDNLFRVLTAAPVTGVGDLPRAARELKLARALPLPTRTVAGR